MKVQEAKTHLSALLAAVEQGEDVVIARGDTPVATLTAIGPRADREFGFVPYTVPDIFFEPLTAAELAVWEQ